MGYDGTVDKRIAKSDTTDAFDGCSRSCGCHITTSVGQERGIAMSNPEFEALRKATANDRYEYFVKHVADYEEVWGLFDEGWAMTKSDEGDLLFPVWPTREFANHCAVEEWSAYKAEEIDLESFLEQWLPGLEQDGHMVSVFWNLDDAVVVRPRTLCEHLTQELEKY